MSIEFKEGSVCFTNDRVWYLNNTEIKGKVYDLCGFYEKTNTASWADIINIVDVKDFQLNTPCTGWYIHKSEIDTEQKYNNAGEVFELFGFDGFGFLSYDKLHLKSYPYEYLVCHEGDLYLSTGGEFLETKCTYSQLMAIGKLKRMIDEKEDNPPYKLFRKLKSALDDGDYQEVGDIQSGILKNTPIFQGLGYYCDADGSYTVKGNIHVEEWKPTVGEEVEAVFGDINSIKGKLLALTKEYAIIQQEDYEQHLHLKGWILKEPQFEEDVIRERVKDLFTDTLDATGEDYSSKELAEYLLDMLYVSGYKIVEESDCD